MLQETTFAIKTFLRPICAHRLIESILDRYPDACILVADDSRTPIVRSDVRVLTLPFDSGIGAGRNHLVDRIETEYFVLLDDDVVFTEHTNVEGLLGSVRDGDFDIAGGCYLESTGRLEWEGVLERRGDTLFFRRGNRGTLAGIQHVDMCHNFFAARTALVRELRWDPELKVNEHTDFFLRGLSRVRVGFDPAASVFHAPERSEEYDRFRGRDAKYRTLFMRKHGLRRFVNELHPELSILAERAT